MPVYSSFPRIPRAPRTPRIRPPARGGVGPALTPLKGPAVEIPGDQETGRQERWRVWQESPDTTRKGSGSYLEFICWEWLHRRGQQAGRDFIYQYPLMGGRTQFGGFVADFYFPFKRLVWNPAGLQFHYTTSENRARDRLSKAILAKRGIKVIFLFESDLLERPDITLEKAWNGEQLGGRDI